MFGLVSGRKYRQVRTENEKLLRENHYLAESGARLARERCQLLCEVEKTGKELWRLKAELKQVLGQLRAG